MCTFLSVSVLVTLKNMRYITICTNVCLNRSEQFVLKQELSAAREIQLSNTKAKVPFLCQTFYVLLFLAIDQCSALHRDIANDSTSAKQA